MKANVLLSVVALIVVAGCGVKPVADHHQHLMSPAAAESGYKPPLPAVRLPEHLARLLQQRAEKWRDADALEELYTKDAWVLGYSMPGWDRGPRSVKSLETLFYGADNLVPVFLRTDGSISSIAGYYTRGKAPNAIPLGYFHMTVETGPDGVSRIASETPAFPIAPPMNPIYADDLIEQLDEAGIQRAVVLSNAYFFDGLIPVDGDVYAKVRAENDWTAEQVMRHPDRLVALCSFNPLKDYAIAEMERCSNNPAFTGVKLHLGTSGVDLDNPEHVATTRRVFEAANRLRLPLLVHTAATTRWGAEQAATFVSQLAAAAPDVQVVVAHLWGGAFYNAPALGLLADAVSSGKAKNLHFELASVYGDEEALDNIARRMRQIGLERIYFGSDAPPEKSWDDFRRKVPLGRKELEQIAGNVAPCAKRTATTRKPAAPASQAPIRTDRSHYVLTSGPRGPEATIQATLRAPADRALYIVNCNGASSVGLQRKAGQEWVLAWVISTNSCLSPPIVVPPGGEHTASVFVHENSGAVTDPARGRMIESGTYRVIWTGVLTAFDPKPGGFGPELPVEQRVSAPITIEVPPIAELTVGEGERLVRMLAEAINDPGRDVRELEPYILHGPEALRVALVQYRTAIGKVTGVRHVKEFIFELQGTKGTSIVQAHREDRVRIHSALLDYGFRAERFMKAYLDSIVAGDAERLARVLNPDDIDFPVPRAKEMIEDYRRRYRDVSLIRPEFLAVDESKNVLRWRLRGPGADGREVVEPIDLGFGDGLIGVRGLHDS